MNEYLKNLNRLEFVETWACTGQCKHCSEGEHPSGAQHLDGLGVSDAIRKICEIYSIESMMVFGGEPLLFPEDVCRIFETARECEIPGRSLITNGYFSKDRERINQVADMLAAGGAESVLVSADAFHQETIPLEPVLYFAECVRKQQLPVKISPAWLVSPEADNPYNRRTREILAEFTGRGFTIAKGNVIWAGGNAKRYLSEYFDGATEVSNPYEEDPYDMRTISFNPDGEVLGGNCYERDICEILAAYRP